VIALRSVSKFRAWRILLLAVLSGIFCFTGLVPAWRRLNTDFPNYFVAASIHSRGLSLDRAYEWPWFQRQKDHLGIDQALVGFAPHPPLCALPFLPLTHLSALNAKRVWLVFNVLFLAIVFWILQRLTSIPWLNVVTLGLLCIVPLRSNLQDGQYYILILLLISAGYYAWRRKRPFVSGLLLSAAAALKLFPGMFLLLFLWKRQWRAVGGFVLGFAALTVISILTFGWNVHQVYVVEVLPRAMRGDLLGPYFLGWSSFSAYWHHAFLYEPELNPVPLVDSPTLFAVAQALTTTVLWFSYFLRVSFTSDGEEELEWSAFVPLMLLLNPMPSSYHYCVLIFSAIVGAQALQKRARDRQAIFFIVLYAIACAPWRGALAQYAAPLRLISSSLMYVVLLKAIGSKQGMRLSRVAISLAGTACILLMVLNLRSQKYRDQDFRSRVQIPLSGYRYGDPVSLPNNGYLFTEMVPTGYTAGSVQRHQVSQLGVPGDVLSVTSSPAISFAVVEGAGSRSLLYQVGMTSKQVSDATFEGQQPSISPSGEWLAFIQEERGESSVWLVKLSSADRPRRLYTTQRTLFELTVGNNGDVIIAEGEVTSPRMLWVDHKNNVIKPLREITGAVRFPALSADDSRLAFSRRNGGSWHLFVHDLTSGAERQLTRGSCNAVSPAWQDPHTLLYATDCGRGLGLSAIARASLQ
jgi:Glycosyltransferase family 87/WD40-like Beta Propeller Repeat